MQSLNAIHMRQTSSHILTTYSSGIVPSWRITTRPRIYWGTENDTASALIYKKFYANKPHPVICSQAEIEEYYQKTLWDLSLRLSSQD